MDRYPCPECGSVEDVRKVRSIVTDNGNKMVFSNFCRKCLVEFLDDGQILIPIRK